MRSDFKYQKRISKKEKEDEIKRPFQKYFLQPSALMVFGFLIIVSLAAFFFFNYQKNSLFPKNTKSEISEIAQRMEKWNEKYGQYPTELNDIIGNNLIRQEWKNDT